MFFRSGATLNDNLFHYAIRKASDDYREANFQAFFEMTSVSIKQMQMFLKWAKTDRANYVAARICRPIELCFVYNLESLTAFANNLTSFLEKIYNRPEKQVFTRENAIEETTTSVEASQEVIERLYIQTIFATFRSAVQRWYKVPASTNIFMFNQSMHDLLKASSRFIELSSYPRLAEEQSLENARVRMAATATNSRQSPDLPTTPTDTNSKPDSHARQPSVIIVRKNGIWTEYELIPLQSPECSQQSVDLQTSQWLCQGLQISCFAQNTIDESYSLWAGLCYYHHWANVCRSCFHSRSHMSSTSLCQRLYLSGSNGLQQTWTVLLARDAGMIRWFYLVSCIMAKIFIIFCRRVNDSHLQADQIHAR